jgi:hypothetical protein
MNNILLQLQQATEYAVYSSETVLVIKRKTVPLPPCSRQGGEEI